MAFPSAYHADSDADDEYERSILTSPVIPGDDDGSHSESGHSTEHTPTTFDTPNGDKSSPKTIIPQWTSDECAKFLTALNLSQYCNPFIENEIDGEALIALGHDELKEMGIASAGHRLTILKGVYDIKVKQDIPIEADDYVPPSAEANFNNKKATQDDISRIIQSIRLRDEQMVKYEAEIKRITEEYRKLREELLPVFRMTKERQPLPSPYGPNSPDLYNQDTNNASPILAPPPQGKAGISRKGSRKGGTIWSAPTPKNASPTYAPSTIPEGKIISEPNSLYPLAAAMTASLHFTVSAPGGGQSPNPASLPSPTSPNNHYSTHQTASRIYGEDRNGPRTGRTNLYDDNNYSSSPASTIIGGDSFRTGTISTTSSRFRSNTRDIDDAATTVSSAPSVEIFKSFRVSMEDPCHKVLPAALKKYNIQADWRQYALYIVYGDQERCLGLEEKPLILFKQLDKEGKKPMFMLRRHAPPSEGHSGPTGMLSFDGGMGQRSQSSFPLPGGVL